MAGNGSSEFEFIQKTLNVGKSIAEMVVAEVEEVLADFVIMGSTELARESTQHLGSVSAAVAKRTSAHVLIAKNFA